MKKLNSIEKEILKKYLDETSKKKKHIGYRDLFDSTTIWVKFDHALDKKLTSVIERNPNLKKIRGDISKELIEFQRNYYACIINEELFKDENIKWEDGILKLKKLLTENSEIHSIKFVGLKIEKDIEINSAKLIAEIINSMRNHKYFIEALQRTRLLEYAKEQRKLKKRMLSESSYELKIFIRDLDKIIRNAEIKKGNIKLIAELLECVGIVYNDPTRYIRKILSSMARL